jgi:tetratricopeptide (TPR) repeat protein
MASLFDKLLGSGDGQPSSTEVPRSATLLKQVTKLKEAGRFDEAVETLREAYRQIQREGGGYTIQTYLRLPMLLQKLGRADEAWGEYNRLLASDPTGVGLSRELTPMFHSQIYDKMRLFLQREGQAIKAVGFGAMSTVSWATGLYHQKRHDELRDMLEDENLNQVLHPLLRKAKKLDAAPAIISILRAALTKVPNVDMQALVDDIYHALVDGHEVRAGA